PASPSPSMPRDAPPPSPCAAAASSRCSCRSSPPPVGRLLSVLPHPIIVAASSIATMRTGAGIFMLIAKGLEKTYRSGERTLTVLRNVDLDIEEGDFVAILGPSGSGKTTLLGLLAGLDTPTRGSVEIDGTDLAPMTEDERARFRRDNVGFVFQSFQLLPSLTALENVQVPLELRGDRDVSSRAAALLERV